MLALKRHSFTRAVVLVLALAAACGPLFADEVVGAKHSDNGVAVHPQVTGEKDFLASLEAGEEQAPEAKEPPVYVTMVRFTLSLALVLGLAYATILGLRRFTGLKTAMGAVGRRIRVVENTPLGANRALHLVEIGQRRLVLASTPSQVNLIAEMSADDLPEPMAPEPPTGFKDQLATFLGAKPDSENSASNVAQMLRDSTAFLQGKIGQIGSIRRRLRDA